jgi:hypothetical protein
MYQFLFLGHTSLNYVYAEHHHRELLAEAERERQLALAPASRFTWASVFSRVKAGLQTLLRVRTRVTDSEVSTSCQSQAHKPEVRRPDRPAKVPGREHHGQRRAIGGGSIGGNDAQAIACLATSALSAQQALSAANANPRTAAPSAAHAVSREDLIAFTHAGGAVPDHSRTS